MAIDTNQGTGGGNTMWWILGIIILALAIGYFAYNQDSINDGDSEYEAPLATGANPDGK